MKGAQPRWLCPPAATLVGVLVGCDPAPPSFAPVEEPTSALRPPAQRGVVPDREPVITTDIDARLDAQTHRIEGRMRIRWRNTSSKPATTLPFHLYMNGFRAADTAWMAAARGSHRGVQQGKEQPWGYVDVTEVRRVDDPTRALTMVERPEPTIGDVALHAGVPPGQSIELELAFTTQLPEVFARTGFKDDFHMVGQWFPKLAVREPDGRWADFDFSLYSEFYADFGPYTVDLDVPAEMVVGATGIRTHEQTRDGRKHLTYEAQWVHDFAWTAWPAYEQAWDEIDGVRIRMLVPPGQLGDAPLHFDALRAAFSSMEARFGPYPWSTLTVVQPPSKAAGAGGMEYPTLFTTDAIVHLPWWVEALGFDQRMDGRATTVHEFGHQWFQGLLASNEHAAPWLDEGVNTFSNVMVLEDRGAASGEDWLVALGPHTVAATPGIRLGLNDQFGGRPIAGSASSYEPATQTYGALVYGRTAAALMTLRNIVGHDAFDAALRDYALRYRFEHPSAQDFKRSLIGGLSERTEVDVEGFLRQAFDEVARVDVAVRRLGRRRGARTGGYERDAEGELVMRDDAGGGGEAFVVLERKAEFVLPVDVEVQFTDGEVDRLTWHTAEPLITLAWPDKTIARVDLDPEHKLVLEADRRNNHRLGSGSSTPPGFPQTVGGLMEGLAATAIMMVGP